MQPSAEPLTGTFGVAGPSLLEITITIVIIIQMTIFKPPVCLCLALLRTQRLGLM